MGLFTSTKNPCAKCGGPTRRLFPTTVEDQPICGDCKDKIDLPDDNFYGMSLADVRQYIAFYDENKSLRDIYQETFSVPCGGWNDQMSLDMDHRLFRIRMKGDAMALEAAALKGFRILEDERVLYESSPEGLKYYPSNIPARAQDLAPAVAQFQMQYQQYEHMAEMEKLMKEQSDGKTSSTSFSYMPRPQFNQQVIEKFQVELTLDHPYWGGTRSMEYTKTPQFSDTYPDVNNFLKSYKKHAEILHTLALNLMNLIDPDAPEIQVGAADQAVAGSSAPHIVPIITDPVKEIQKYKSLLDSGVITEEEFAAKKRQLLGI